MFGKSGGECGVEGVGVCEGGEGMSGSGKTEKYGIFGAFVYAWVGFVCAETQRLHSALYCSVCQVHRFGGVVWLFILSLVIESTHPGV